jgi:hypothetical protein
MQLKCVFKCIFFLKCILNAFKNVKFFPKGYLKYKFQNYTVAYQSEQKWKVGIIQNFFKIPNSIYCVILKL